jgi:hypothetical protein
LSREEPNESGLASACARVGFGRSALHRQQRSRMSLSCHLALLHRDKQPKAAEARSGIEIERGGPRRRPGWRCYGHRRQAAHAGVFAVSFLAPVSVSQRRATRREREQGGGGRTTARASAARQGEYLEEGHHVAVPFAALLCGAPLCRCGVCISQCLPQEEATFSPSVAILFFLREFT